MEYYTIKDICKHFGVTRQAVSKWIRDGKLKVIRTPLGRVRVTKKEFKRITKEV